MGFIKVFLNRPHQVLDVIQAGFNGSVAINIVDIE
jgi:hypothetical protein